MTQEELIDFLKENLRIEVYSSPEDIEVSLYLCNEKISSSCDELNFVRRY